MEFEGVNQAFRYLIDFVSKEGRIVETRGLKCKEVISTSITLKNIRKRFVISNFRKTSLLYAFAEFFWYLSRSNKIEMIKYYAPSIGRFSDDGITMNSAYGYCIWDRWIDQWSLCLYKLKQDPNTRQAIILLRDPFDLMKETKDCICTICLQFLLRDKLDLVVYMRSNDLMVGFVYDVFSFTMLQELMAKCLNVDIGKYHHHVGSLHIYDKFLPKVDSILSENITELEMEEMSFNEDIFLEIFKVLSYEATIRKEGFLSNLWNIFFDIRREKFSDYWKSILYFFLLKRLESSMNKSDRILLCQEIVKSIRRTSPFLRSFIDVKV